MKNRKFVMILAISLMAIGFASVSTVLYLNGQTFVEGNNADFDVYFSKAIENGVDKSSEVIKDKTHIQFETELSKVNEKYVLNYDVTNGSKQYDANLTMNCVGGNEYIRVENKFDTNKVLPARQIRSGRLTITLLKGVLEERRIEITCEITGTGVEREETGGEEIEEEPIDYLKVLDDLWSGITKSKVESITFLNTKEGPENATLIGDVSKRENGSIMMYSQDEDSDELLELYIGQNGGVNANPYSTHLFFYFTNVTSINGLENLNTTNVTNMSAMFSYCENLTSLDVSGYDTSNVTSMDYMFVHCYKLTGIDLSGFDTSNVTNMWSMFSGCSSLTSLEVNGFDTSNVTDMHYMFNNCKKLTSLDVSKWNTSNVTNMYGMFSGCSSLTSLDVSKWNTSKVTNMEDMFLYCSSFTTLDVSGFNTSNVTNMKNMFNGCSSLTTLELSSFDTSKVTNMKGMFANCSKLTTTVTIRGIKCISYAKYYSDDYGMFEGVATEEAQITVNYTEDASDLVDQMIATKSDNSNIIKGSVVA